MALPSGYTKLDYIESSGTQYINTGFKPNQNTRVVMDVEVLGTTQCAPFGARASQSGTTYTLFLLTATTGRTDYGTSRQAMTFSSILGRYTIDANKNVVNVNGVSITHTASTFSVGHNIFLLAVNTAGTASNFAKVKLYSCKIYDNGTLVRDFIPCKNASGTIGLWDNVNSVFYANAGTGTFSTGTKHKTLIDGTGYEIKSGRVLIAGTGYDIKKGRTLIGGTGYDIKFATPIGELDEGSIIKINESGSPVEFYVAKHNYESGLNGVGRTLVVRKDCYSTRAFASGNGNYFPAADICTWLNETYIGLLDNSVQAVITPTTFKVCATDMKVTTAEKKIFLLSATELGYVHELNQTMYAFVEGEKLDISDFLTPAKLNGEAVRQWTRSIVPGYFASYVCVNNAGGDFGDAKSSMATIGVRPIFALPETMEVDGDFILIEP